MVRYNLRHSKGMHFQIESMGSVAKSIECDGSPYSLEGHSLVIYTT